MTQDRTGDRPTPDAEHWMAVTRQVQALAVKVQRISRSACFGGRGRRLASRCASRMRSAYPASMRTAVICAAM